MFRLRFSIRTLLVVILLTGSGLAVWAWQRHRVARRDAAILALASAPNPIGWDFNPVALIRAVNQLHQLGHEDALVALEQFDKTYSNEDRTCPHQSLELAVPLLFDRRKPDEKYPRPKYNLDPSEVIESGGSVGIELDQDSWSIFIVVQDGIPFHTVNISVASGMPRNQSYLIVWAKAHAQLRESPLIPGDLILAAEKVMLKLGEAEDSKGSLEQTNLHVRMQVYRAVEHLLNRSDDDKSLMPTNEKQWLLLKKRCDELGIVWNKELQAFTSTRDLSGS